LFGSLASNAEVAEGENYFESIAVSLEQQNVRTDVLIRHGKSPSREIVAAIREVEPDLVIMAQHGHRGVKDLFFGTTINSVRHQISVPVLIVSAHPHRK
jgi:manganese transport protein